MDDKADQLLSATKTNTSTSAVLAQYFYGYDLAGNRTSYQHGLRVIQASFNNLNQTASANEGGPLQFTGTLSKPGMVTVGGNPATMDSSYENFSGSTSVTSGTNSVPVVATSVNGYATTNNYQVVVPPGGSATPTYDANGNLTDNGRGQTYTWDAQNELTAITYSSGANSGNHTEFFYDAAGRRTGIIERTGTTLHSGTVTSTKKFVWIDDEMAEERDGSNSVTKRFYPQGEQISGTSYYYTRDHLGSIREMVDNSGNIQARYDYDPYGVTTLVSGTDMATFGFAGMQKDPESGLYLTLYRIYNALLAIWYGRDPMGEGSDATLHSYVYNDPVDFIDPFGLKEYPANFVGPLQPGDTYSPIPMHPATADVNSNMKQAATHSAWLNPWWFKDMVKAKAPWDYKRQGRQYEDFGNFNYGACGMAGGFSPGVLLRQAGKAQIAAGTSMPGWGDPGNALLGTGGKPPFGDDPEDQKWIQRGMDYSNATSGGTKPYPGSSGGKPPKP